jgi:hypothetical protein
MVLLETTDSAVGVAAVLADRTSNSLSKTAKHLYMALVGAAIEVSKERSYSPRTSHVTYFCPAESVALAVGIHPATLYRKLPELREHGLVDCRGHYCTHNGRTRSDGSVWTVRLTPTWGSAARVPFDYLKRQYRSLGDDIAQKRTAYAQMRESYQKGDKSEVNLSCITQWALSTTYKEPNSNDSRTTRRIDLETIFDVPHAPKQERADMVYKAAQAMSSTLGEASSTRWFCALLWGLLKLKDRGGGDYFAQLHTMVCRVRADYQEWDGLRSPGALLTSRLKSAPWWDEIRRKPLGA